MISKHDADKVADIFRLQFEDALEDIFRLRTELADARGDYVDLRGTLSEVERERNIHKNAVLVMGKQVLKLEGELADARELLQEAIPHLVGNNHWDGVARIRAHLALAEADQTGGNGE